MPYMQSFKNILIVRTDRMGDVILTTPAIRALRQKFPDARLSILVAPATADLVRGNHDVDEVLVDDRKNMYKKWRFFRLVSQLRQRRFDLAIIFHTKKRTNMLCFLAGIPYRLGYRNKKFGFLLNHPIVDTRPLGLMHEAQYCMDVLRPLGIAGGELQVHVPLQKEAEAWVESFWNQQHSKLAHPVIAIHSGASCPTRRWPSKCFVEVMKSLQQKYRASFILVGAADQNAFSKELLQGLQKSVVDLMGNTSLAQLASVLNRCDLLISSDSGPVHLADGLGTPVVSIFTRNQPGINPERWRPLSSRSRVVAPPLDMSISFAKGEVLDAQFLELIQPQEVLAVVDDILKLC
ncbi:MAG: glycosyltransferase family 9 protein [Candidatus Omnitrophica bacterium]|nr:glycosyltransferase family 9 protein [Candidatus Omnitrophota bacterium]